MPPCASCPGDFFVEVFSPCKEKSMLFCFYSEIQGVLRVSCLQISRGPTVVCSGRLVVRECKESQGVHLVRLRPVMSWARQAGVVCSWEIGGVKRKGPQGVCLVGLRSV